MTRWQCNTCPFTTSDEDAARGHIAGPHTGRGWLGEGEAHSLSLIVEPVLVAGDWGEADALERIAARHDEENR